MSNALLFTLSLWPRVCINCHIENMEWGLVAWMTTGSSSEMATLILSWDAPPPSLGGLTHPPTNHSLCRVLMGVLGTRVKSASLDGR